jgi:glycosyltransferase involved in cell wall biosynthesis
LLRGYLVIALTDYDRQVVLSKWKLHPEIVKVAKAFLYLNSDELSEINKVTKRDSEYITHALEKTRFLYVGRLVHDQKRVDHLVKVFYRFLHKTRDKYPSVELVLLGSGPLRETLENMVRNLAMQDHVRIVGAVSDEEKWLYYLSSTAVVSMSEFEGLPRVIFEAFASGKIVIAPDICGLKEVIHQGVNGFLFKNDEEFINILESLAANRHKLFIMQKAIREANVVKFEADANKEEMCAIIRKCAERHD